MNTLGNKKIVFITDIEGNLKYLKNFVDISKGLKWKIIDKELDLHDGFNLVVGGDIGDKGTGSLRCYHLFISLKKKYHDRVVLLLGNRDINKMRFTSELHDSDISRSNLPGPYWVSESERITPLQYLKSLSPSNSDNSLQALNTKINRLKWMLKHTMGSEGDFERRRQELSEMDACDTNDISDQYVLNSFCESVGPDGIIREYLVLGVLGAVVEGNLFVHGGIAGYFGGECKYCIDLLEFDNIIQWVSHLNSWCHSQIKSWEQNPFWNADRSSRGGDELLDYIVPTSKPSVIMARHLHPNGMPLFLETNFLEFLQRSCIERIVVGHTPHGNCPTVIRQQIMSKGSKLDVILADTSYSDLKAADFRGIAVSEVLVDNFGFIVHGILDDGKEIRYDSSDPHIGRMLENGFFVKARLVNGTYLCYHVQDEKKFTYNFFSFTDLNSLSCGE